MNKKVRARLLVYGVVQGVGFRPFVDRFARENRLTGWVLNASSGVEIEVEGKRNDVKKFVDGFSENAPPMSLISHIDVSDLPPVGYKDFVIKKSIVQPQEFTLISPDMATCEDCLKELQDPQDRRFGYPFINCTNCGPRYTIIRDIPYDRSKTTMKKFVMCPACQKEYKEITNRRFHTQPNACPDCGPKIWLLDSQGNEQAGDGITKAKNLLSQGKILAVKGLGGFHLVCDAQNEEAVKNLRQKKRREEKPFALMVYSLEKSKAFCFISKEEEKSLLSIKRPIVLLKKKKASPIAPSVAPRSQDLGVMLPYTPLHYLLMDGSYLALVMTSGNISQEPIVFSNEEALERLKGIADYYLLHNRDIYTRSDDSVVYIANKTETMLRRSRGYCPLPIHLGYPVRHILACGAELKNTICLTRDKDAFVSQYIGDLENLEAFNSFEHTIHKMKRILKVNPRIIAYDMHPDYLSTKYAQEISEYDIKIPVQHHHAHVASCMAENGLKKKVIGLAWDGTGYGEDGCVWGGEFLLADFLSFERKAFFSYLPMPGGERAIKEPYRMAISYLYQTFGDDLIDLALPFLIQTDNKKLSAILETLKKGINSPLTSSAGRFFESISSIVGVRNKNTFEGQAAIELEYLASSIQKRNNISAYPYLINQIDSQYQIDVTPMIKQIVKESVNQKPSAGIAFAFHITMAQIALDVCRKIREECGITSVVLSGGVFQNRLLVSLLTERLDEQGFDYYIQQKVPANDGGISLGQAAIAHFKATEAGSGGST